MKLLMVCVLFFGSAAWAQKLEERLGDKVKSPYQWSVDEASSCKDGKTVVLKCVDFVKGKIDIKVDDKKCEGLEKVPYECDGTRTVIAKPHPIYYWKGRTCMKEVVEKDVSLCPSSTSSKKSSADR